MTASERLAALLDALPRTANGIAEMFGLAGVRGRPLSACDCPAARWIARRLADAGGRVQVRFDLVRIIAHDSASGQDRTVASCRTPLALGCFAHLFDSNAFPHLKEGA